MKGSGSEGGDHGWREALGRGCEGEMHLGGAAAEERGGVEVQAGVLMGEGRDLGWHPGIDQKADGGTSEIARGRGQVTTELS